MTTLGAPGGGAGSGGHHGVDSRQVRPMVPSKRGSFTEREYCHPLKGRWALTSSTRWDAGRYLRYADERGRPFVDLVARVGAAEPAVVVDLGCGPGNMTARLADRWPGAKVIGVDSSEEMVARARAEAARPGVEFRLGDLRDWAPDEPVDVIVSAATLHWVPGHLELLPRLLGELAPAGWFAFQVPGNFGHPSHVLMRELATSERWKERLAGAVAASPSSEEPSAYLRHLLDQRLRPVGSVDVWETTYLHVLSGPDPVLEWVRGTGLRPVLDALRDSPGETEEFLAAYAALLRAAYPPDASGRIFFPFRRIFVVLNVSAPAVS